MLPACRTASEGFAIPQFAVDHGDVEGWLHELRGFHRAFRECFARSEPREHFFRSMVGQFSQLERKSIEPIALRVEGGHVRARQRCLSEVVWDDAQMRHTDHGLVNDDMGEPNGLLVFDETGFPKQGKDSVGSPANIVRAWAAWSIVRSACWWPTRPTMARRWWTSASSCPRRG